MHPLYIFFIYQHVVGKKPKWSWDPDEGDLHSHWSANSTTAGTLCHDPGRLCRTRPPSASFITYNIVNK